MSDEESALLNHQLDDFAVTCALALAPTFAATGWIWARYGAPPNAAQIALRLRRMMAEVQMDHSLSTGRLHVYRYVEDGNETIDVSLHLGSIYAAKPAVHPSGSPLDGGEPCSREPTTHNHQPHHSHPEENL